MRLSSLVVSGNNAAIATPMEAKKQPTTVRILPI
jgi:hypothetical protein